VFFPDVEPEVLKTWCYSARNDCFEHGFRVGCPFVPGSAVFALSGGLLPVFRCCVVYYDLHFLSNVYVMYYPLLLPAHSCQYAFPVYCDYL